MRLGIFTCVWQSIKLKYIQLAKHTYRQNAPGPEEMVQREDQRQGRNTIPLSPLEDEINAKETNQII